MTACTWRSQTRLLAGAHLLQAVALLGPSSRAVRRLTRDQNTPPTWILRVLGARILLQAAPEAVAPQRGLLQLGIGVDLIHATSMLAAARTWPTYRRAALISAASAAASAMAGGFIVTRR